MNEQVGYPVQCGNCVVVLKSLDEVAVLLQKIGGVGKNLVDGTAIADATLPGDTRWTTNRVRQFSDLIDGERRKLLDLLLESPEGKTDRQLCQELGVAGKALGAYLASLVRTAGRVGVDAGELYTKHLVSLGGDKRKEYRLTSAFRKAYDEAKEE
ncbi:MAG: hypothetical protein HYZ93_07120 [Candidatus Omnitrophica bacterium]|nr:hypothetical protein [Candidatus Omnitrophota bacterium]